MRRQVVNIKYRRSLKTITEQIKADELYAYTSKWYEKLAWWVVRKLGIRFQKTRVEDCYASIPIDTGRILDAVDLCANELEAIHYREARYLLIGNKQAHELFQELPELSHFNFDADIRYHMDGTMQVRGLTMVVVPWMDGFCLVPELRELATADS
jgi:hypothetical protein